MDDLGMTKLLQTVKNGCSFISRNKEVFEDALPGIAEALMDGVNSATNSDGENGSHK